MAKLEDQLKSDVYELKAVFRSRAAIHEYLSATLRKRNLWAKRMKTAALVELAEKMTTTKFDARITKKRTRILLELSCDADSKTKAMYGKALENARGDGCTASGLKAYLMKKGGIAKAAYTRRNRTHGNDDEKAG